MGCWAEGNEPPVPTPTLASGTDSELEWFADAVGANGDPKSDMGVDAGDFDNDGDEDLFITELTGEGSTLYVIDGAGSTRLRRARADGSYASANDPRVLVGLGESSDPVLVRVTWPAGHVEEWSDVSVDRYTTLTEGGGR